MKGWRLPTQTGYCWRHCQLQLGQSYLDSKKMSSHLSDSEKFKGVLTISLVVGSSNDSLVKWGFDGWLFGFVEICRVDSLLFSMPVWCGISAAVDANLLPADFRLSAEMAVPESRGLALARVEVVCAVKPAATGFATWVLPDKYSALTEWYWICDTAGNRARCLWHDRSGRNPEARVCRLIWSSSIPPLLFFPFYFS